MASLGGGLLGARPSQFFMGVEVNANSIHTFMENHFVVVSLFAFAMAVTFGD
jgi:hypothetical protein